MRNSQRDDGISIALGIAKGWATSQKLSKADASELDTDSDGSGQRSFIDNSRVA